VCLIAAITFVNYRGVTLGAAVQKLFTLMKVAALAILVAAAFLSPPHAVAETATGAVTLSGFGVAMISCVLSYDGWVALSFVAGEVKDPKRILPRALAFGVGLAIAIYVLTNIAYLRVLSIGEIAATARVGAFAAERTMGPAGGAFVSFSILMSIIGAINGWALAAPRIYFAQAQDGLFFKRFAVIHPRFQTPYVSILTFGVWSALLALTGTYETLASYAMYAAWVFYALTAVAVIALRRKQPDRPRPYRMTGYPLTLLIFAAVAIGFVINTFLATPGPAIVGTLLIGAGVPVYFIWRRMAG
jgi:APA family basic amino acid/polyamine antiporter